MNERQKFWDKKISKYASEDWIDKPSIFARWAIRYFPRSGKILDLGAGHGQDSRFFASKGYKVICTDFSQAALQFSKEKLPEESKKKVIIQQLDLSKPFPFRDKSFEIVYAHLAIQFFDDQTTNQIFSEICRVLRPKGIVAGLVNSTNDSEYKQHNFGKKKKEDYFELEPGNIKRFFSLKTLKKFLKQFKIVVFDNQGATYKDTDKGVFNLIRFVVRK